MEENAVAQMLGEWYDNLPSVGDEKRVRNAYRTIAERNEELYRDIPVPVVWQSEDPYDSYADMAKTVGREQQLRVFDGGSEPKFISHAQNVKGRAVHDWYGHLSADCNFSLTGECQKFAHVRSHYPRRTHGLLFSEVVGQRAAASYYADGFFDDRFEQKAACATRGVRETACQELLD
jgi:hypothetical protein